MWNSYFNVLNQATTSTSYIEMFKQAAISVKYELERLFRLQEHDYDVNCACVLYDPFQLHIDISPKHKRCMPLIASIYLH
jgi:hypothetical protein